MNTLPTTPYAWSFSLINDFETCGRQFHEIRVLRNFTKVQGPEAIWGDRAHKALDEYVAKGVPLPPEFSMYQAVADVVRRFDGEVRTEQKLCVTHDLQPCDWSDKAGWSRGIIDFSQRKGNKLLIGDYKTGKVKLASKQLLLFALLAKAHWPEVEEVTTVFVWLKFGKVTKATYRFDHPGFVARLWEQFRPELTAYTTALSENIWIPKPSGLCKKYCDVLSCEYNGKGNHG